MGPKTAELCDKLQECSALLKSAGELQWSEWLDKSRARLQRSDLSGVDHLLEAYGGMGSFNDLVIMAVNGHSVTENNCREVNERLFDLRSDLYELARVVRRNAIVEE